MRRAIRCAWPAASVAGDCEPPVERRLRASAPRRSLRSRSSARRRAAAAALLDAPRNCSANCQVSPGCGRAIGATALMTLTRAHGGRGWREKTQPRVELPAAPGCRSGTDTMLSPCQHADHRRPPGRAAPCPPPGSPGRSPRASEQRRPPPRRAEATMPRRNSATQAASGCHPGGQPDRQQHAQQQRRGHAACFPGRQPC